jgi:predicted nucleic acid-binding protein
VAVIDASVYVAVINADEEHHERSWAWFEQAAREGNGIAAPSILLAEVAAALGRGMGDRALAHRVVQQMLDAGVVELVAVTEALAQQAADIAADHRIRGCDAVYVALAAQLDDLLVTLDQEQLERAAALVTTRMP